MSKHVVLALWTLGRGGAERVVVDIARRLPHRGYIPRVIALGGGGPLEEELRSSGIEVVVGPETYDRRGTRDFARRMVASIEAGSIVHTHLGADHWLGYPAFRKGHAWLSTCHNDDRDDAWWKRRLKVWTWNRAPRVLAVSQAVQTFWRGQGANTSHWRVLPNAIEIQRFSPKTRVEYSDEPLIVSVGRLVEQKRHEWLLRALAPIHRPWRLELVGDGPLRSSLEALADTLGIRGRVSFRGVSPDVRSELARADLFAFSSAWEGQGLAVLEAAAAGVPLLLSDLPVFHEWLSDQSALFVEDSIDAWTAAFERALHDPRAMQQQAWRAHEDVLRAGDVDAMVDAYVQEYENITRI